MAFEQQLTKTFAGFPTHSTDPSQLTAELF